MSELIDQGCILHTRPLRESSLILTCLTATHGLMSFTARGGKRSPRSTQAKFQPFQTLSLTWRDRHKTGLVTLRTIDITHPMWLTGLKLKCGLYLNQLLIQLLNPEEPCQSLFDAYTETIKHIDQGIKPVDVLLRHFEHQLFAELGFSIPFEQIENPYHHYTYDLHQGFLPASTSNGFQGEALIKLAQGQLESSETRQVAKYFSRQIITQLKQEKFSQP